MARAFWMPIQGGWGGEEVAGDRRGLLRRRPARSDRRGDGGRLGHVTGADAGRGRTRVDMTPRLRFLARVWRPRGPDRLFGASRSPIAPAAFLRAVAGNTGTSSLDDMGLIHDMLFDGPQLERQSRVDALANEIKEQFRAGTLRKIGAFEAKTSARCIVESEGLARRVGFGAVQPENRFLGGPSGPQRA